MGVEKLLGITDDIPDRANVLRVLMMELTRIGSHLVAIGTGGNEMGATTVMTTGFIGREETFKVIEHITGLRTNNAYIRPGGVAIGRARRLGRDDSRHDPQGQVQARRARVPPAREPHLQGPAQGRRRARPRVVHGARRHGPDAAFGGRSLRPAQVRAVRGLRDLRLPGAHLDRRRCLQPRRASSRGVLRVAQDRRAVRRPSRGEHGRARHGGRQEDRVARPALGGRRRPGQLASSTFATSWASRWRPSSTTSSW